MSNFLLLRESSAPDLLVHIIPQIIFLAVNGQLGLDAVEGEGAYLVAQLAEAPKVQGILVVLLYGRDLDGAACALVLAAHIAERGFKLARPQRGERVFPPVEAIRPWTFKYFTRFGVEAGAVFSRVGAGVVFFPAPEAPFDIVEQGRNRPKRKNDRAPVKHCVPCAFGFTR